MTSKMTSNMRSKTANQTLFEILAARGLTASAVARAAGVSERTLHAHGDTAGSGLRTQNLQKLIWAIERLSGTPAPPGLFAARLKERNKRTSPSPSAPRLPLNRNAQGARAVTGNDTDQMHCPPRLAQATRNYMLIIAGESMSPRYEPGELIFVSPRRSADVGDDVLIVLRDKEGKQTAHIRRLVKRGRSEIVAKQFNPLREVRFSTANIEAIHLILRTADIYGY